jgi:murein DD-endopeptidase MepM/ murein hydrolase activator NlpD
MFKKLFLAILISAIAAPVFNARAQETVKGPIYIIQSGDSLTYIASRFGVPLAELMSANNISNANSINAGERLIIPGLGELDGVVLNSDYVKYGQTLHSFSRIYGVSEETLKKLNHITSPSELFAGVLITYPEREDNKRNGKTELAQGETFLEMAVRSNQNPWTLTGNNSVLNSFMALPGEGMYFKDGNESNQSEGLPAAFESVKIDPLPLIQGSTHEIRITLGAEATLSGTLINRPLNFFQDKDGSWVALQGIHALQEQGAYPLALEAILPDGSKQKFEQPVLIIAGSFPREETLLVEPQTIDPAVTEPELKQLEALVSAATSEKYWSGKFTIPAFFSNCLNSGFGKRRTYIGKDTGEQLLGFHSGVDYCGGVGAPIYAPADGVVVFADFLTVRGNATIIDHGWGVYSGMWHQSEIKVQAGQKVTAGEEIGFVGGTGRVTGAHLHWEIWVNGVQVNPLEWLEAIYP